ncbi:MAG: hypothetical protein RR500_04840 [Bacilli bacterium]
MGRKAKYNKEQKNKLNYLRSTLSYLDDMIYLYQANNNEVPQNLWERYDRYFDEITQITDI